jgi:hypothetical protein
MHVNTESVGLVVSPLPIVDISVDVHELSLAVSMVLSPLARVLGTVRPMLLTLAVTETSLPLTVVDSTTLETVRWAILTTLVRIEGFLRRNSLLALFISEVLAASNVLAS